MSARALIAALALTGCASTHLGEPINAPLASPSNEPHALGIDGDAVVLSFSGGGARAAAFSLGVLQGLRDMPAEGGGSLLDRVVLISAVSGGAITAAYYGQNGAEHLDDFRATLLDRPWGEGLHNPLYPSNWSRLYSGGLNEPGPLADWLDADVFHGATMGDLAREGHARIWINATDLHNGAPFAFTPFYFDALCSDLGAVRVGDAVASSMSVPLAIRTTTVQTFPEACAAPLDPWVDAAIADRGAPALLRLTARAFKSYRDPNEMRFVHLVDGGVTDNFGLSSMIATRRASGAAVSPLSFEDAIRARRVLFLVVNAERSRADTWQHEQAGPDGPETLSAAMDASIDSSKRFAYDSFIEAVSDWESEVRSLRCGALRRALQIRGTLDGWTCDDVRFTVHMLSFADVSEARRAEISGAATDNFLPPALIDALIAAGQEAVRTDSAAQAMARP
ncbi:MAG: patatin-like phospholipase family protein [Terricaulis sp.]